MILRHRDRELLRFDWVEPHGVRIVSINDAECFYKSGSTNYGSSQPLAVQIKENLEADPFITYVELSKLLHVPPRTLARRMKELQSSGEIRRVGATKNGHWEVLP